MDNTFQNTCGRKDVFGQCIDSHSNYVKPAPRHRQVPSKPGRVDPKKKEIRDPTTVEKKEDTDDDEEAEEDVRWDLPPLVKEKPIGIITPAIDDQIHLNVASGLYESHGQNLPHEQRLAKAQHYLDYTVNSPERLAARGHRHEIRPQFTEGNTFNNIMITERVPVVGPRDRREGNSLVSRDRAVTEMGLPERPRRERRKRGFAEVEAGTGRRAQRDPLDGFEGKMMDAIMNRHAGETKTDLFGETSDIPSNYDEPLPRTADGEIDFDFLNDPVRTERANARYVADQPGGAGSGYKLKGRERGRKRVDTEQLFDTMMGVMDSGPSASRAVEPRAPEQRSFHATVAGTPLSSDYKGSGTQWAANWYGMGQEGTFSKFRDFFYKNLLKDKVPDKAMKLLKKGDEEINKVGKEAVTNMNTDAENTVRRIAEEGGVLMGSGGNSQGAANSLNVMGHAHTQNIAGEGAVFMGMNHAHQTKGPLNTKDNLAKLKEGNISTKFVTNVGDNASAFSRISHPEWFQGPNIENIVHERGHGLNQIARHMGSGAVDNRQLKGKINEHFQQHQKLIEMESSLGASHPDTIAQRNVTENAKNMVHAEANRGPRRRATEMVGGLHKWEHPITELHEHFGKQTLAGMVATTALGTEASEITDKIESKLGWDPKTESGKLVRATVDNVALGQLTHSLGNVMTGRGKGIKRLGTGLYNPLTAMSAVGSTLAGTYLGNLEQKAGWSDFEQQVGGGAIQQGIVDPLIGTAIDQIGKKVASKVTAQTATDLLPEGLQGLGEGLLEGGGEATADIAGEDLIGGILSDAALGSELGPAGIIGGAVFGALGGLLSYGMSKYNEKDDDGELPPEQEDTSENPLEANYKYHGSGKQFVKSETQARQMSQTNSSALDSNALTFASGGGATGGILG